MNEFKVGDMVRVGHAAKAAGKAVDQGVFVVQALRPGGILEVSSLSGREFKVFSGYCARLGELPADSFSWIEEYSDRGFEDEAVYERKD